MKLSWIAFLMIPFISFSQEKTKKPNAGDFELGMRSTVSAFGDAGYTGLGFGGQFRMKLAKRLNTEWYADYVKTDLGGAARRNDAHIGWSVMFYPWRDDRKAAALRPYLLAGHCFDYTKIVDNSDATNFSERWSSAVQAGLGTHFYLTERMDLSISSQYMSHLGNGVHTHIHEHENETQVEIEEHSGAGLEGHLLFTLSMNVLVADLW